MAGIKITGLEELHRKIDNLSRDINSVVLADVHMAAAKDVEAIVEAGAPVKKAATKGKRDPGQLKSSVAIHYSVDRKTGNVSRLLVGPSKSTGFYGYFLDKGWKMPIGPAVTYISRGDRWHPKGTELTTKRRRRKEAMASGAHSQMGRETYREIPGTQWFLRMTSAMEQAAERAGESAFLAAIERLLK